MSQPPEPAKLEPPPEPPAKRRRLHWGAAGANLVFPGAGQYLQKRYVAGTLFLLICLAGLGLFLGPFALWMIGYVGTVKSVMEGTDMGDPGQLPFVPMLIGLVVVLADYVWSILDAARGRRAEEQQEEAERSTEEAKDHT